jgi:exodeoxyribonuclease III
MAARNVRIITWNVNGLRSIVNKYNKLEVYFANWDYPDIVCMQETKMDDTVVNNSSELKNIKGYNSYWSCHKTKKGYSGVVIYVKENITVYSSIDSIDCYSNSMVDNEGRLLAIDLGDFVLFNIYCPNSGPDMAKLQNKLNFYKALSCYMDLLLKAGRQIIITGDLNTIHKPFDTSWPVKETSIFNCFEPPARSWLDNLLNIGFIDVYRKYNPSHPGYTWFKSTYNRASSGGLRLDYMFMTGYLYSKFFKQAVVHHQVMGSDHAPLVVDLAF